MGISNYFQHLRSLVGHELILCPGVTAVVVRDTADHREVLLVQRADDAEWTPVSGALEPGEDADVGAVREVLEETRLQVAVDRVLWIQTLPRSTYPNGDQVQYYDTAFSCRPVAGTAEVGDDESRAVGWFSEHALPPLAERFRTTIALALNPPTAPAFGADRRSPGTHP